MEGIGEKDYEEINRYAEIDSDYNEMLNCKIGEAEQVQFILR
jgi:hypothetical protein